MKNRKTFLITLVILIALVAVVSLPSRQDNFNLFTGKLDCTSELNCWHEAGHATDIQFASSIFSWSKWTSQQLEFQVAVDSFIQYCDSLNISQAEIPYCNFMAGYPGFGDAPYQKTDWDTVDFWLQGGWGGYIEVYADILACAYGTIDQMPAQFQEFYDQDYIDQIGNQNNIERFDIPRCMIRRF